MSLFRGGRLFRIGRPSAKDQKRIDEREEAEKEARQQKKHEDEIMQMKIDRLYHPRKP